MAALILLKQIIATFVTPLELLMKLSHSLLALAVSAFACAPALAQSGGVTLRVDSGSVMTSQGGEFVSASSGAALAPGSRVMLSEDSQATLVYGNGCTRSLGDAGVYNVPATCSNTGAAYAAAGTDWQGALIIAGGTAAVAAGLASMDEQHPEPTPPPPVSR